MSEEEKKPSLNEDMVRAILKMNPQLRGDGESTKQVLEKVQATRPGPAPAATARPAPQAPKLHEVIAETRRRHGEEAHGIERKKAEINAKVAALEGEKRALGKEACTLLIEAFKTFDPNLTKREHQVLMQNEKPFFDRVQFNAQTLLAALKR